MYNLLMDSGFSGKGVGGLIPPMRCIGEVSVLVTFIDFTTPLPTMIQDWKAPETNGK